MTELNCVTCLDRSLYVHDAETLVIADVHLGRGIASNVDAPIDDGDDVISRVETLLEQFTPKTLVVAGDLLHSFSWVPQAVERRLTALVSAVERRGVSFVVTQGNHDTMLDTVYDGKLTESYRLADGETVVCHGHERPEATPARYVIGHDHPAISIDGRKVPCYLYGQAITLAGTDVFVLPAFSRLARGMVVNNLDGSGFQSPIITATDDLYPGIRPTLKGDTLWFPRLGDCRALL